MTESEKFYHQIALEIPDAKEGIMFGAQCIKMPNGKASAMYWKDCIVVKLTGEALAEAKSLDGSCMFDPGMGRPMKEWVQIPFDYKDKWKEFASIASEYVKLLKK